MFYSRSIPYFAAWCIVLGLLLWALQPVLTKSHLEGFTYITETMSILAPDFRAAEQLWGVGADYFYLTRPGTIWVLAPFSALVPGDGYQLLMWVVTPIFLSGLIIVAKTWSGASWLASFAALLFVPIAIEANFFANDNVLAASFSLWGMVLLLRTERFIFVALAGALLGLALLCRLDQVMLVPLFGAFAALKGDTLKAAFLRCVILLAGFLALCLAGLLVDPDAVNIVDRIAVAKGIFSSWGYTQPSLLGQIGRDVLTARIAFGLGFPAIVLGMLVIIQKFPKGMADVVPWLGLSRPLIYTIMLLVYPVLVLAMTTGLYLDPRAFLTIIPMLLAIVARGLDVLVFRPLLVAGEFRRETPLNRSVIFVAVLGPLFVPVIPELEETESPVPYIFGRIWHVDSWTNWQSYFPRTEETADRLIDTISDKPSSSVVTTWTWTSDRQFQNRLAVAGFVPTNVSVTACLQNSEVWVNRDGVEVYHLRMHIPFAPLPIANTTGLFIDSGFDCLRLFPEETRYSIGGAVLFSWAKPLLATARTELGWYRLEDDVLIRMDTAARRWMVTANDGLVGVDAAARQKVFEADAILNPTASGQDAEIESP